MKSVILIGLFFATSSIYAMPGGYTAKGGVVDFQKPLDYFDQAVNAGKFAWNKKFEDELSNQQVDADREVRHAYVPTFFTSESNHAALAASRAHFDSAQVRPARETQFQQPLYYSGKR